MHPKTTCSPNSRNQPNLKPLYDLECLLLTLTSVTPYIIQHCTASQILIITLHDGWPSIWNSVVTPTHITWKTYVEMTLSSQLNHTHNPPWEEVQNNLTSSVRTRVNLEIWHTFCKVPIPRPIVHTHSHVPVSYTHLDVYKRQQFLLHTHLVYLTFTIHTINFTINYLQFFSIYYSVISHFSVQGCEVKTIKQYI